jgi:uncharacterized protein (TIGR03437 family)
MWTAARLFVSLLALVFLTTGNASGQSIAANPPSLDFYYQTGGNTPSQQSVQITGTAAFVANVTASVGGGVQNWLFPVVTQPVVPFTIGVVVAPGSLAPGVYQGNIRVAVPDSTVPAIDIPVRLTISQLPLLVPNPASLTFVQTAGGAAPAAQTINLGATSAAGFSAAAETQGNVPWLNVTPLAGTAPATLTVNVQTAGLSLGTYTGAIRIVSALAGNSPVVVPVTLRVTEEIRLTVNPSNLTFDFQVGEGRPPDQAVSITTTGGAAAWTGTVATQSGGNWLGVSILAGTTPSTMVVGVSPAGLPAGTYTGTVTITAAGASNSPQTVTVTLRVTADPVLRSNPPSLSFVQQTGTPGAPPQTILLTTSGAPVNMTLAAATVSGGNWLTLSHTTATTPAAVVVSINAGGLAAGSYSGAIVITGAGAANTLTIPVSLLVSGSPMMRLSRTTLTFFHQIGQAAPPAQMVTVSSTSEPLNYTAAATTASGGAWLNVAPLTGVTPGDLSVSVNPVGLAAGVYNGTIAVQPSAGGTAPITVAVRLVVDANPLLRVPSGPLEFSWAVGGSLPANVTFPVASTGAPINFTVTATTASGGNWLIVAPDNGTSGTVVSVGVSVLSLGQGTFTGVLTVGSTGTPNSPQYIPVVLRINQTTELVVPTERITFTQQVGGQAPGARQVTVRSNPAVPIRFDVSVATFTGAGWLIAEPGAGLTESTITIRVNTAGLAAGQYEGEVVITSSGASNSPRRIPVTLLVQRPLPNLAVSVATVPFTYQTGGALPQAQSVQVSSSGEPIAFAVTTATTSGGAWLFVSTSSTTTPATLNISVNPAGLASGNYNGTVTLNSQGAANSPVTINVTLAVAQVTTPVVTAVTNAASFQPTAVSPGLWVTLFGTGIGPTQLAGPIVLQTGLFDTTVAGTRVLFDNIPAPIVYVRSDQSTVIVPYEVAGRATVQLVVEVQGVRSTPLQLRVVDAAPGIFQAANSTNAAALNQNGTVNTPGNPADRGQVVVLYTTGEGLVTPPGINGQVIGTNLRRPVLPVRVRIGGVEVTPEYAGSAPGIASGVMQVNVRIPANAPVGAAVPIDLLVGNFASAPGVTLAIR